MVAAFALGALATCGAMRWLAPAPASKPTDAKPGETEVAADDPALERANANLAAALQACNRKLEGAGNPRQAPMPVANASPPDAGDRPRPGLQSGDAPTKDDWERMAEAGMLYLRVPCVRDTPWVPPDRLVRRLGLAPNDVDALRAAYASSNKRLVDQVRPICAKVLGGADVFDRVGVEACVQGVLNSSRKVEGMKASLTAVAEVQADKRQAPKPDANVPAVEQLALVIVNEQKAFERDLGERLGGEDGKRFAWMNELCHEEWWFRDRKF